MRELNNIDELISKYFSGEASPEEAMLLHDWKNENEENRLYYVQCERMFLSPVTPDIEKGWNKVKSQLPVSGKVVSISPVYYFMRIAASVVLVIGLATAMMYWLNDNNPDEISYATNSESKQVTLSDGSDITISPNSSLTADDGFGKKERMLRLKGSAYFSVVHDEKVPFVVDAGGIFIKDIGTRFLIRTSSDTDTVYVHVDEGIVLLFDENGGEVEIKAGGNALYIKSKKQIVSKETKTIQPTVFAFSNNTLEDVVKNLNIAYKTNIVIANPVLNKCTITTQFKDEKLATILSVISETLGLTYEKTTTGYILRGAVCQQ